MHGETSRLATDEWIAAILRGDPLGAEAVAACGGDALRARAFDHDVLPLVADRLSSAASLPDDVRRAFQADVHAAALHDLTLESELRRVVHALAAHGIDAVLFKGSHLAYSQYPRPELRARTDADVLIARTSLDAAHDVLTRVLGYAADPKVSGELTATQRLYMREAREGAAHMVDLHWRLASPQVFAHVLSFEELLDASVPLPALSADARVPSDVHALVIACMHRVAHHHDEAEQFKWLYDIHLLASRFDDTRWTEWAALIVDRRIAAVCMDSVRRSARWFRTPVPSALASNATLAASGPAEDTAAYLRARSQARMVLDDVRALPDWSARRRLIMEHLFPSENYMRTMYAPGSKAPLLALYVWRFVRGVGGWLRPPAG